MRVLITGMSGTGKSTVIDELRTLGFRAVDADEAGWSEYRTVPPSRGQPSAPEWMWRENRIEELLSSEGEGALFLSGCASNQVQFYGRFDHIVLLSAPADVLIERLAARTNNAYGKRPGELTEVLENQRIVEPLLRSPRPSRSTRARRLEMS